jgi:predicted phosphoribosyltransferase
MTSSATVQLPFADRYEAGRQLAAMAVPRLPPNAVILALPRGGMPVAYELALASGAPLDVFVVRKLGVPGHEELAMGAIASGGGSVLNRELIEAAGISPREVREVTARAQAEMRRREELFRAGRSPLAIAGHTAVLVDDGLATGATMLAAVAAVRRQHPAAVDVAVPIASAATCATLGEVVDMLLCLANPEPFYGVGQFYVDFTQTSDDEVRELLRRADARSAPGQVVP